MAFTTKKVKSHTLGEFLAECRNQSGLSLSEIARLSRVQPKYIIAFEEGKFGDLPAVVYVKGFLFNLARIYRVNAEQLVEQYLAELQIEKNVKSLGELKPKARFRTPHFVMSPKTLTVALVVLVGILSLGYLYFQVSSLKRPPALEAFSPETDAIVDSSILLVRGKTEAGASVFLNNQPIVVDVDGEFQEQVSLAPGTNNLVIKSVNKFGKESSIVRSIILREKDIAGSFTQSDEATVSEHATSTAESMGRLNFEIKVGPEAAWVSIVVDGLEEFSGTILPNASETFVASEKIVLTTGNAGSTRVILNGKDFGVLGRSGEVIKDLEFTQ